MSNINIRIDPDINRKLDAAIEKSRATGLRVTKTDVVIVGIQKFIKAANENKLDKWL